MHYFFNGRRRFTKDTHVKIYLVGGAVRDQLLGYPYHERDWVVVGSTPQAMFDMGYSSVGKDFPVFLHPETKEEYALARLERKTGHGYAGFQFDTSSSVTLTEDLSRRDLTINAIAQTENGDIIDPFSGATDIKNKILRHVSTAFAEDPVRILRIARFAARYHHLDFRIAPETMTLMKSMVTSGEVDHLVAERVWQEFEKALSEDSPHIFISVLQECGALSRLLPELDTLFGVPQPEKHHPEIDTGIHCLMVLEQATKLSTSKTVRFAALMHDLGKGLTPKDEWPHHHAHETKGLKLLTAICQRLKVPNAYYELAAMTMEYHTHCHRAFELTEKTLAKLLEKTDAFRRPERFLQFLICCKADSRGRTGFEERNYPQANYLHCVLRLANAVEAKELISQGFSGAELGKEIKRARVQNILTLKKEFPTTKSS